MVRTLFALACGALAATPVVGAARRASLRERLPRCPPDGAVRRPDSTRQLARLGIVARVLGGILARRQSSRERAALEHDVPVLVDLLQVAVGAGSSPFRAIDVASRWGPERTADAFRGVLAAVRLGEPLADALARLGARRPVLAPVVDVMIATEQLGTPAGPALGRVAEEVRADLRRRAEARARVLPVKLLFPLVFLVLPAFGLLTVVPTLLSALTHL